MDSLAESLARLRERFGEAEIFHRKGRSRRVSFGPGAPWTTLITGEEGWAARAGDRRGAFFALGTGEPTADTQWPQPVAPTLRLPDTKPIAEVADAELDLGLLSESEARALIDAVGKALDLELPGAKLRSAVLEEGSSESRVQSSRGARAQWRARAASLRLQAGVRGEAREASLVLTDRSAARFSAAVVGRRLADRLHVAREGRVPDRDRGDFVLAPPVAARLLAALKPLWLGPRAPARCEGLRDRRGRMASELLTLVDDGGLPGGVLSAPADGEGVATREIVVVESGLFRQPLLSWAQARPPFEKYSGCSRRDGWRDLPKPGFSHFYAKPRPDSSPGALLGAVARGYYLLDAEGPAQVDASLERFALPVCGFSLQGGRAVAPIDRAWLVGSVAVLLRNVQAVARDLSFFPFDGMIGSPTLLVTGLELLPHAGLLPETP